MQRYITASNNCWELSKLKAVELSLKDWDQPSSVWRCILSLVCWPETLRFQHILMDTDMLGPPILWLPRSAQAQSTCSQEKMIKLETKLWQG